jgi:PKD repeat protein
MKVILSSILLAISIAFITISCSKKSDPAPVIVPDPVACFTISPSASVMVGQNITATNCSSNATSYLWEDGDGYSSTNKDRNVSYVNTGTYTLKLTAQGNGKVNITSQVITVSPAMGNVIFWENGSTPHNITTVTIDGKSAQITSSYSNGIVDCNQSGCASFYLPSGTYPFTATDGASNWSGSVTIGIGTCFKQQLL